MEGRRNPPDETHVAPPGDYQSWDTYMQTVEAVEATWEHGARKRAADYEANSDISETITKAMRLAPNTLIFRALLEGQEVPVSALDPVWAHRYGLRKAA